MAPRDSGSCFFLALPATLLTVRGVGARRLRAWVRWRWDHRRGTPGFYESDPARIQRLSAGYDGWFAGVPVRINNLGFRDRRDYDLAKPPGTFRILVLGDSVTFGHGSHFETTYPYLLEQRLKAVAAVDELAGLEPRRPRLQHAPGAALPAGGRRHVQARPRHRRFLSERLRRQRHACRRRPPRRRLSSGVQRLMQRHLYSYEFYKRVLPHAALEAADERGRPPAARASRDRGACSRARRARPIEPEQQLTDVGVLRRRERAHASCASAMPKVDTESPGELSGRIMARAPDIAPWLDAVADLRAVRQDRRLSTAVLREHGARTSARIRIASTTPARWRRTRRC